MTFEDLLLFAMTEDNNVYLGDSKGRSSFDSHAHGGSDEGFYSHHSPNSERTSLCSANSNVSPESAAMRRVKSTPNLLQIPKCSRSRKRSDDSAVGSAEESELSDKMSESSTDISKTPDRAEELYRSTIAQVELVPHGHHDPAEVVMVPTLGTRSRLLRPPSVVVSDHDLCPDGGDFITLDDIDAAYLQSQNMRRRLSDCSTCSSLSFSDSDFTFSTLQPEDDEEADGTKKVSRWKAVKTIFHQLSPFILTYKNSRYPWVQLAGHQGNFKPGEQQGTILKKFCVREKEAFEQLMNDSLKPFVPQYYGTVRDATEDEYIQLEDLLVLFQDPCVMDCKVGVRTYLEEELLKAKEKPKLRKDMYEKMYQVDPTAPTSEEHQLRGVTKPRYMVWRETISTTSTFGFRIEGVRTSGPNGYSTKDFKTTRSETQVSEAFLKFIQGSGPHVRDQYLQRLKDLRTALSQSQFFATHEVIGSSLLFVHDQTKASVWMIDFAKTCRLPEEVPTITHDQPWSVGNHEDGYLIGLSHLIKVFTELSHPKTNL